MPAALTHPGVFSSAGIHDHSQVLSARLTVIVHTDPRHLQLASREAACEGVKDMLKMTWFTVFRSDNRRLSLK